MVHRLIYSTFIVQTHHFSFQRYVFYFVYRSVHYALYCRCPCTFSIVLSFASNVHCLLNRIEMREGMAQPGERLLTTVEKDSKGG
jgi:hypothetical protein